MSATAKLVEEMRKWRQVILSISYPLSREELVSNIHDQTYTQTHIGAVLSVHVGDTRTRPDQSEAMVDSLRETRKLL